MAVALPSLRAIGFGAAVAGLGALAGGAVVILSGVYNVAASVEHFVITDRVLRLALRRSVDTHSLAVEVPDVNQPDLVRLGALHFANGCQPCHAGPGIAQNPIAASMYPAAPLLESRVEVWQDRELFWIVRHGLKFTGMPQWAGEGRDDEVWPLVAFLRALPGMSPETYARLAQPSATTGGFVPSGDEEGLVGQCASCHGGEGEPPVSGLVPPLDGQREAYLLRALEDYASGRRQSGMMEPVAAALSPGQVEALAAEFSSRAPLPPTREDGEESTGEGGRIVLEGLPRQNLPACVGCHGQGSSGSFPALAGLPEAYIATQLRLFRDGTRGLSPHGRIMQQVAGRLTDEQIGQVAAYLARQPALPPSRLTASTGARP